MFPRFHRSTLSEPSQPAMPPSAPRHAFQWAIMALFATLLLSGLASATWAVQAVAPVVDHSPLLKVVPQQVGIPGDGVNCTGPHGGAYAWICHVTLTEVKSSASSLHWSTRSDQPAKFTPSNGTLSPGQSIQVIIATNACGGFSNFYFVGPKNVATVTYQCG